MKIICLHGFGGNSEDWQEITAEVKRLENRAPLDWNYLALPGHGEELSCAWLGIKNYFDAVSYLRKKVEKISAGSPFLLCGYSMGARLALSLAADLQNLAGLVLLSCGMGFEEEAKRQERLAADRIWRKMFQEERETAWTHWYKQAVFSGSEVFLLSEKGEKWIKSKSHQYSALGEALETLSPGLHPSLLPSLIQIKCPVLYLYGEKDSAYVEIADSVRLKSPTAKVEKIGRVGHILPLEAPVEVAQAIRSWRLENGI